MPDFPIDRFVRRHGLALATLAALALVPGAAHAQQVPAPEPAASTAEAVRAEVPLPRSRMPLPVDSRWEGAIGLVVNHSPTYQGSAKDKNTLVPGIFLRYGRFTVTNASGFVSRRSDDIERGVTAELLRRDNLRIKLSARFDGGRDAGDDPALQGLPDVRVTLRARLSVQRLLAEGWQLNGALSPDVLGRGGGMLAEGSFGRQWWLRPGLRASADLGLAWADSQYMRTNFGITPTQSAITGLRAFAPGGSLRNVSIGAGLNTDFGPRWIGYLNVGASHLLGEARDSPLTRRNNSLNVNAGLAWRF